ncbi:MAG: hypothetical protein V3S68_09190 [Dehalococcoidia bacterium]
MTTTVLKTQTHDEVLESIANMSGLKPITLTDASNARFMATDDGFAIRPTRGGKAYDIGEDGLSAALKHLSVPERMFVGLTKGTAASVLTETVQRKQGLTLLTNHDNVLVDMTAPGKFNPIDASRVFKQIERAVPGFDIIDFRKMPNHTVSLDLLGIDEPKPIPHGHDRANDLLKAGIHFEFSPLGITDAEVQAFALRLVCLNGLTHNDVIRQFSFGGNGGGNGDPGDIYKWFRSSAKEAYKAIDGIVARCAQMSAEGIEPRERALVLTALLREAGMGKETNAAVEARALEHPPENEWDMHNLLTWGATHVEQDPVRRRKANRAAADFADADQHARFCPTCHRN